VKDHGLLQAYEFGNPTATYVISLLLLHHAIDYDAGTTPKLVANEAYKNGCMRAAWFLGMLENDKLEKNGWYWDGAMKGGDPNCLYELALGFLKGSHWKLNRPLAVHCLYRASRGGHVLAPKMLRWVVKEYPNEAAPLGFWRPPMSAKKNYMPTKMRKQMMTVLLMYRRGIFPSFGKDAIYLILEYICTFPVIEIEKQKLETDEEKKTESHGRSSCSKWFFGINRSQEEGD
ncbi:MAG: hypothetical protein ACMG6E_01955, partial [Candidatus Roizmanbacteria bacterium]